MKFSMTQDKEMVTFYNTGEYNIPGRWPDGQFWLYIVSLICFARMNFSEQSHIKGRARDAMRNPFRAKHINDSMFIEDLLMWHHNITLENSDIMACKDQREHVQIIDKCT